MKNQTISDEFLNAFVDHELEPAEINELFDSIEQDDALKGRVCELRSLKEVMQHAYLHPPVYTSPAVKPANFWSRQTQSLAACLLLVFFCGASGLAISASVGSGSNHNAIKLFQSIQSNADTSDPAKIIVQVSSSNPVRLKMALDETENLLESYRLANRALKVEVIANGGGMDLLRSDVSPYVARIGLMKAKYKNLDFVACNQTVNGLMDKGIAVQLVPNIRMAASAFDEINLRINQGWDYVRV